MRVGRYKAKYRTGGIATECPTAREGPRKAPLLYHEPPLLFDLASDPAERNNLNPSHPYYAAVLRGLFALSAASLLAVQLVLYLASHGHLGKQAPPRAARAANARAANARAAEPPRSEPRLPLARLPKWRGARGAADGVLVNSN